MGRHASATPIRGHTARNPELAKKALSIRPAHANRADAARHGVSTCAGQRGRAQASHTGQIAWAATLRKGRPQRRADLHWQQRRDPVAPLWLVIVDASASTRRHGALTAAKGMLAALFDDAYRQRARLALLTVNGAGGQWQRQGLKASAGLQPWLEQLGAGGGTPLLQALEQAGAWLQRRQRSHPAEEQRCLVVTDGRIKEVAGAQPMPCQTCVMDIERGPIRLGRCKLLAAQMGAHYLHIDNDER